MILSDAEALIIFLLYCLAAHLIRPIPLLDHDQSRRFPLS